MSEANGHNGNGHPPVKDDVYPRIGKLETGMARLESNVQVIHEQVSKINSSIDKIADSLGKSREANYPFMVQTVGVCIALAASIGGVFIAPLRTADSYHERAIDDLKRHHAETISQIDAKFRQLEAKNSADHDSIIILKYLEERRVKEGARGAN